MKIVKESKLTEAKEKLPISFLTDFVSRGWDDVGYLKETIKAISESYSGTKNVEELLQALVDAYLVCIGQLELCLQHKDYLNSELGEKLDESKKLNEDIGLTVSSEEVKVFNNEGEEVASIPVDEKPAEDETIPPAEVNIPAIEEPKDEKPIAADDGEFNTLFEFDTPEPENVRKFEKPEMADFFVDFDDPVGEPVSEKDLYGEGEDPIEGEKIDDGVAD